MLGPGQFDNSSLPAAFRAAASAVTSLYKEANEAASNGFKSGYHQCLVDIINHFNIEKLSISQLFNSDQILSDSIHSQDFDSLPNLTPKKFRDNQGNTWFKDTDLSLFVVLASKKNNLDLDSLSAPSPASPQPSLHSFDSKLDSLSLTKPKVDSVPSNQNSPSFADHKIDSDDLAKITQPTNTFNFRLPSPHSISNSNPILNPQFSNRICKLPDKKDSHNNSDLLISSELSSRKNDVILDAHISNSSGIGTKRRENHPNNDPFHFSSFNDTFESKDGFHQPLFGRNSWSLQPSEPPFKKVHRLEEMDINE
ncbi:hypothetical protein AYI68_g6198 [Smittium mucronatum]|uniref:Uncharacterized protein n=1 Tax=Smittium mucronatum TaxID=133383 RepID=A0A1R0GS54_9FUNG|nr:hypothetical protein AYI68_g6198 [Smittium mucronatum]